MAKVVVAIVMEDGPMHVAVATVAFALLGLVLRLLKMLLYFCGWFMARSRTCSSTSIHRWTKEILHRCRHSLYYPSWRITQIGL